VRVDDRDGLTPGFKFNDAEMRGVPLRVEIGPKDVAQGTVTLARRDRPGKEGKSVVPQEALEQRVGEVLEDIHRSLLERARTFQKENTHEPRTYDEFKEVVQGGWALAWWCGESECEATIKEETKAATRNIPLEQAGGEGVCVHCGKPAHERALWARAY